jgi:hypothetical protein
MRPSSRRWPGGERGSAASMIEILFVAVIILFLAWFLIGRTNKEGRTLPAQAKRQAVSVVCRTNLNQIRTAITMYRDQNDDANPPSLSDLRDYGVDPGLLQCPVGKIPYVYDPATGTVHCRYPGHEQY